MLAMPLVRKNRVVAVATCAVNASDCCTDTTVCDAEKRSPPPIVSGLKHGVLSIKSIDSIKAPVAVDSIADCTS